MSLRVDCVICGEKAHLNMASHAGDGSASFTFLCRNHTCMSSFVFLCRYARAGRGEGGEMIEYLHQNAGHKRVTGRKTSILCPECGQVANVTKTHKIHRDIYTLYCRCRDPSCGMKFSCSLEFSHMISVNKTAAPLTMAHDVATRSL